jgi:hypothetical protein
VFVENDEKCESKCELESTNDIEDVSDNKSERKVEIKVQSKVQSKEKNIYACDLCDKKYKLKGFLANHLTKVHGK